MPGEDLDHIPGWEGDVEEKANLAREVFFFCHLPEHDGDDDHDDGDDDHNDDDDDHDVMKMIFSKRVTFMTLT